MWCDGKEPRTHQRVVRFTDEIAAIIEEMDGNSFHDKFENLVLYKKLQIKYTEETLEKLNKRIDEQRETLAFLSKYFGTVMIPADKLADLLKIDAEKKK